jgi:hypothetical protein
LQEKTSSRWSNTLLAERAMRARRASFRRLQYQSSKKPLSLIRILAVVCAIVGVASYFDCLALQTPLWVQNLPGF